MDAVVEVMDANQATINAEGVGFKGFIPATFARLVNEAFGRRVGTEAAIKITAPPDLVRNRQSRPDAWEIAAIRSYLQQADWPKGQTYAAADAGTPPDREAFLDKYAAIRDELAGYLDSFDLIRAFSFEVREGNDTADPSAPSNNSALHIPNSAFQKCRKPTNRRFRADCRPVSKRSNCIKCRPISPRSVAGGQNRRQL